MIYFPNVTLHRYTLTDETTDVYGATCYGYEYSDDVLVDFQNENNSEIREQYGVERGNLYKVYFDKNTVINDSDELRDDDGNCYEIIGEVMHYHHFLDYNKAHMIRKRVLSAEELLEQEGTTNNIDDGVTSTDDTEDIDDTDDTEDEGSDQT